MGFDGLADNPLAEQFLFASRCGHRTTKIHTNDEMEQCLLDVCDDLEQIVITDDAINEWCKHLRACIHAK